MAHTVTITTSDDGTLQDIENFLSSLYQRGLDVSHETVSEGPSQLPTSQTESISEFPEEVATKSTRSKSGS